MEDKLTFLPTYMRRSYSIFIARNLADFGKKLELNSTNCLLSTSWPLHYFYTFYIQIRRTILMNVLRTWLKTIECRRSATSESFLIANYGVRFQEARVIWSISYAYSELQIMSPKSYSTLLVCMPCRN